MQLSIPQPTVVTRSTAAASRARPVSAWDVFYATVLKELWTAPKYKGNLIGNLIQLGIRMLFFVLLSNIVAVRQTETFGRELTGKELFIFFQGALLLFVFKGTALWTPLNAVTRDLSNGTLEYLYSNPCSRYAYYMGTVVSDIILSLPVFIPMYIALFVASGADVGSMLMILLVCLAIFFTLTAMGVMIGLLGLLWKQAMAMAGVIEICLEMLSGAYFPIATFPLVLQYAAYILPFTWGFDLIRYYSFGGDWVTLLPVWLEWLILGVFALAYTAVSRELLRRVERHAKQRGLHLL
jgi:ABC-2 type transport system permease protein